MHASVTVLHMTLYKTLREFWILPTRAKCIASHYLCTLRREFPIILAPKPKIRTSPFSWAPAGFFPGVGNEGSEGRKFPNRVQGQLPGEGLWAKKRHFLTMMHKHFVYLGFRQHLQQKKHFSTFPGGKCPFLPMSAGAHGLSMINKRQRVNISLNGMHVFTIR